MPCNLSKCKELVLKKKGQVNPSPIGNIEQAEFTWNDFPGLWQIYRTYNVKHVNIGMYLYLYIQ